MADFITVTELPKLSTIPNDAAFHLVLNGVDYYGTKADFVKDLDLDALIFRNTITPASPAPTLPGIYPPEVNGVYTNYGGFTVDLSEGVTNIYFNGTNFTKQVVPIDLVAYAKKEVFSELILPSKNLFNKETAVTGAFINSDNGVSIIVNAGFSYTPFIAVESSTNYILSGALAYINYYDVNKNFIITTYGSTALTQYNCKFVRLSWATESLDALQFEKGSVATSYENFNIFSKLNGESINEDSIESSKIKDLTIGFEKTNFGLKSKNLYNKATSIDGSLYDTESGNLFSAVGNTASKFIEVDALENYILKFASFICFYNSNRVFISGTGQILNISTPANTAFLTLGFNVANKNLQQLEIGYTSTYYTQYGTKLDVKKISDIENLDYFTVSKNGNGQFSTIADAVNNVPDGSVILVMPGEYKEFVICGAKNVSIIGVDKDKCILWNDSGKYEETPLYINKGVVKNMTIKSTFNPLIDYSAISNFAYALHCDILGENGTLLIQDCNLISDFNNTIGAGAVNNHSLIVRNCYVEATGISNLVTTPLPNALNYHGGVLNNVSRLILDRNVFLSIGFELVFPTDNTPNTNTIEAYYNIGAQVLILGLDAVFFLGDNNFGNQSSELN
jgi:hypothetical protein